MSFPIQFLFSTMINLPNDVGFFYTNIQHKTARAGARNRDMDYII